MASFGTTLLLGESMCSLVRLYFHLPPRAWHRKNQENVYPTGASEQFYDMYLDDDVKAAFARYDVLGVIEHDVKIAHEDSFTQLYKSAFHGSEGYWVKGSVLGK